MNRHAICGRDAVVDHNALTRRCVYRTINTQSCAEPLHILTTEARRCTVAVLYVARDVQSSTDGSEGTQTRASLDPSPRRMATYSGYSQVQLHVRRTACPASTHATPTLRQCAPHMHRTRLDIRVIRARSFVRKSESDSFWLGGANQSNIRIQKLASSRRAHVYISLQTQIVRSRRRLRGKGGRIGGIGRCTTGNGEFHSQGNT